MTTTKTDSSVVTDQVAYDAFPYTSPLHRWSGDGTVCGVQLTTPVVFQAGRHSISDLECVHCSRATAG